MTRYRAELLEIDLWREFFIRQNEMIITKAGRCLFPLYRIQFSLYEGDGGPFIDIEESDFYKVSIEIESIDQYKWKWRQNHWIPLMINGLPQQPFSPKHIIFHDSLSGNNIIQGGLFFDKLKLTNRLNNSCQSICLQSFRRYIPIVRITSNATHQPQIIKFGETEFIAVTHYQNEQITLLKKSYNPHAKGFVLSDDPLPSSNLSWVLSSQDSPLEIVGSERRKSKKIRKRVLPVKSSEVDPVIPSDEEELQGGIALQLLSEPK